MSDLHADAPQPSRAAPYVRATRATPQGATDITIAFDQIFANAAQPAPQARPHVTQSTADAPVNASLADFGKREKSPQDEESAADVVAAERQDAPRYDALPVRQEPRTPAAQVDAPKHAAPPAGLVSAKAGETHAASRTTDRPSAPQSKQPRTTDPRRALTPEKTSPETPVTSQDETVGHVERLNPAAAKRPTAVRSAETTATETRLPEAIGIDRPAATVQKVAPVETAATKSATTPVPPSVTSRLATAARQNRLPREVAPDAPANHSTKVKVIENPVVAKTPATPAAPASEVASAASTPAARRTTSKQDSKPNSRELPAATADVTAAKIARTEPVETAKSPQNSENQRVESKRVARPDVAETDSTKLAAQASAAAVVESQPPSRVDAGAKVEVRRTRETRTTPVANVEIKNSDAPAIVTSQANALPPTPVVSTAPTTNAAPPVPVAPTVNLESASTGKTANTASTRVDQRAAPESPTPTSATREAGKSLADTAKTTAPQRARTDQQQEVDRIRLVQRVAKAVQTAQDRGGPLRLRLTPPELGVLRIELIVRDGALSARLEAETPAAKTAILENLSALRERLTAQEIKIERFDVDLMQQPDSGGERQSFADAESSREQAAARQFRNERPPTKNADVRESKPTLVRHAAGQLNVLA